MRNSKRSLSFDCLESKIALSYAPSDPLEVSPPSISQETIDQASNDAIFSEIIRQGMNQSQTASPEQIQNALSPMPIYSSQSPETTWYEDIWNNLTEVISQAGEAQIPLFHP